MKKLSLLFALSATFLIASLVSYIVHVNDDKTINPAPITTELAKPTGEPMLAPTTSQPSQSSRVEALEKSVRDLSQSLDRLIEKLEKSNKEIQAAREKMEKEKATRPDRSGADILKDYLPEKCPPPAVLPMPSIPPPPAPSSGPARPFLPRPSRSAGLV